MDGITSLERPGNQEPWCPGLDPFTGTASCEIGGTATEHGLDLQMKTDETWTLTVSLSSSSRLFVAPGPGNNHQTLASAPVAQV